MAAFMVGGGWQATLLDHANYLYLARALAACQLRKAALILSSLFLSATLLFIFSYPMSQAWSVTLCYRRLYRTANNQPAFRMMGNLRLSSIS